MFYVLLAAAGGIGGDGGNGLENLPTDPARAWAVIIVVALLGIAPLLTAAYTSKKTANEAKAKAASPAAAETTTNTSSVVINGTVTPHIDASQQLLASVVGNVEERARLTAEKYDELDRRHVKLVREAARAELQVELLTKRIVELEAEVNILNGRLRERSGR